ncbi:MAG: DUF4445 domain-containing protein [Clostridia bacterium]|nr:DUF4445 domain-containing protein [Clostridia bacterium]
MAELTILRGGERFVHPFNPPRPLSDVLAESGFAIPRPCGGRGRCGKCAVLLEGAVSPPTPAEEKAGRRLACQAALLGDASVVLPEARAMEQIEIAGAGEVRPVRPMPGAFGAAVDIGTTTVALKLYDMKSGACLSEAGMLNPQTAVAADVMGRIGAALEGGLGRMQAEITGAIESLLKDACGGAGLDPARVESLVVTGNTTMLYLLTGRNPEALSHAPFEADCLFDETVPLLGRAAYLPRCMHAFVGADITCAALAAGQCERDEVSLLCDVGTNGEIALWKDGLLRVSSTAAGPAFEGAGISCGCGSVRGAIDRAWAEDGKIGAHTIGDAPAVGVCGSGLIDAVAAALKLGLVDETGAMDEDELPLSGGVSLLPRDIRAVQLAKAAIAAGIETLLEEAGVGEEDVSTLYIAGGFGSHLDVNSAAAIGLFPEALASRVKVLGNAALAGAAQLLLDTEKQENTRAIASLARHVNLGGNKKFNEHYMDQMFFPEE